LDSLLARNFISAESQRIRDIIKESYNNDRKYFKDDIFTREVHMNLNDSDDLSHHLMKKDENANSKNYIV